MIFFYLEIVIWDLKERNVVIRGVGILVFIFSLIYYKIRFKSLKKGYYDLC